MIKSMFFLSSAFAKAKARQVEMRKPEERKDNEFSEKKRNGTEERVFF